MSDVYRNPVSEPQDEKFEPRNTDPQDYPTEAAGPGGRTTNIENNEKGILEAVVERAVGRQKTAELGSTHGQHIQGIYGS